MRKFLHQHLMDTLETPCPPAGFAAAETIAFRWVFGQMADERNFMPQYVKKPERFVNQTDKVKCQAMGLSVYDTAESAKSSFEKIRSFSKGTATKLGSHLAKGDLQGNGMADLPNENGHFTFHPFEEADLQSHFSIISKL